ncbi:MAG: Ig-like domain-containing protein [Gammaproteobacteria bacterium]|nr:Ig-like domain-containing protein [Gammaproteobacteria bacterium]
MFTPDEPLEAETTYTATIISTVTDLCGQPAGRQPGTDRRCQRLCVDLYRRKRRWQPRSALPCCPPSR